MAGNLEFFAIYSYTLQQQSLTQIQLSLVVICALLSIVVGVVIWLVIRGIVRPIERVAAASETLASGNLDMRVTVDRKDELGVLQQSFNTMADALNQKIDELEEASVFQKRFVSDVSHELRTPVTTMRMASDLLEMKKDGFDPSTKRTVELLAGQISRFQDMLADLLEISRYDAGYAALDLVETDLCEPIETAVDQVDGIAQAKRVPIHTYLPNVQVLTRIDSRRVIRIVRNLSISLRTGRSKCASRPTAKPWPSAFATMALVSTKTKSLMYSIDSGEATFHVHALPAAPDWACPSP